MKLYCEKCKQTWFLFVNPTEDVWSVFQSITRTHNGISPDCEGGRYDIKLLES